MNLFKILSIVSLLLLAGCSVDAVPKHTKAHLTIASDYLQPSDTSLFSFITDSLDITLEIRKMSSDQLIGKIRNERFNTGIDLVMMRSSFDVNRLRRQNIFHPLTTSQLRNRWKDHNVIPLAIDRYFLVSKIDSLYNLNDSVVTPKTYQLIPDEELVVYLSFGFDYTDPVLASASIKKARKKYTKSRSELWRCNELILIESELESTSKDSLFRQFNWKDPIETDTYNVLTIGIVNQAPNFKSAIPFIRLLKRDNLINPLIEKVNASEIPIHSGSLKLELEDQIQYFVRIERLLR
ncbi:MAG: hypothetical protein ACO2Z9_08585 [Crocinitomicaceae bacterium]